MIYVIATTPMKPENKDDFIKGHKACIAETLKEKGCISYEGHVSVNNPNLYVVVERWETRDDLNAHGRAPHMKVWRGDLLQVEKGATGGGINSHGEGGKILRGFVQGSMMRAREILGAHRLNDPAAHTRLLRF